MHKGVKAYSKGFLSNHLPILLLDLLIILVVFKLIPQLSIAWLNTDPLIQAMNAGIAGQVPEGGSTALLVLLLKYIAALIVLFSSLFLGLVVQQGAGWQWIQHQKLTFDYKKYALHALVWIVVALIPFTVIFFIVAGGTRALSLLVTSQIVYSIVTVFMWTLILLGLHLSLWFFYKAGKGAAKRMLSKDAFVSFYVTFLISLTLVLSYTLINQFGSLFSPGVFNAIFLISTYVTGLFLLSWMRYSIYYYQKEK